MANIKIDGLADAIEDVLQEYSKVTQEAMQRAVDDTARDTVERLKETSPKAPGGGAYAKSWAEKATGTKRAGVYQKTVYNKAHYRLTHLLEKGHATVNGERTAAQPHIAPAEEAAIEQFERELRDGISKGV